MLDIQDNMNLDGVKETIKNNLGQDVEVKIYGMRNRNYSIIGKIDKLYPNLFIVKNNRESISINYSDVLTKEAVIKYL